MRIRLASPTSIIWILTHTTIFLLGIVILEVPQISGTFGTVLTDALGGGLAATGAAGVFLYVYVRQSENLTESISLLAKSGLVKAFDSRAARIKTEYDQRLTRFDYLDVIGFGLSSFREDYKSEFGRWSR